MPGSGQLHGPATQSANSVVVCQALKKLHSPNFAKSERTVQQLAHTLHLPDQRFCFECPKLVDLGVVPASLIKETSWHTAASLGSAQSFLSVGAFSRWDHTNDRICTAHHLHNLAYGRTRKACKCPIGDPTSQWLAILPSQPLSLLLLLRAGARAAQAEGPLPGAASDSCP